MLPPVHTHHQYLEFFQTSREQLGIKVPHDATDLFCKFRHTDLSAAHPILARVYEADRGRPAQPPVEMLRSWLLMLECHITSVEVWVARMREQPFYALLSGFAPDRTPGVGTFYDFQDRLLQLEASGLDQACAPRHRQQKDPAQRDKNNTAPHENILNRLADRVSARCPTPALYGQWQARRCGVSALPVEQRLLKEVFYTVFVATSVAQGLIDLEDLHVAGDGTKLRTWANPHGHKLCACDNRHRPRTEHCDCPRRFHDPRAAWGWDSYRECYVYGHGLYELTAYSLHHACQLPLVLRAVQFCRTPT